MIDRALLETAGGLPLFYTANLVGSGFLAALLLSTPIGTKWAAQALFLACLFWAVGFVVMRFLAWMLWWVGLALYGQGTTSRMATILMACSPALVVALLFLNVPVYGRLLAVLMGLCALLQLLYGVAAGHRISTARAALTLALAATVIMAATLSAVGAALGVYWLLHRP